jgi:hypothetical protein
MKTFLFKVMVVCTFLLTLLLGITSLALADSGFYLGVSYINNNPGAGFNGDAVFTDGVYQVGKPALQTGSGFSITGGLNFDIGALEFAYENSTHQGSGHVGSYYNWDGTATLNVLDMNVKLFFDNESSLKPYGLLGLSIPWIVLPGGEHDTGDVSTGDATYLGFGLNLGGGIDYKMVDRLHLKGEVIYRLAGYGSASGSNMGSGSLPDVVDGSGLCITVGVNYIIAEF